LERQNKELKAKLSELKTAQKTKTKVTIAASETKNNVKVKEKASCRKLRVIAAATADRWDRTALWRQHLADHDLGQILQEAGTGQRSEWMDIADRSPIHKSYWSQRKSQEVRDGVLERH
jgi:hypothetical protein